jgi:hypothetical protein
MCAMMENNEERMTKHWQCRHILAEGGVNTSLRNRTFFDTRAYSLFYQESAGGASESIVRVLITTPGFPLTKVRSGTEFITTLPALTTLPLPTSTPGPMNDCAATQEPSPNVMPRTIKSNVSLR